MKINWTVAAVVALFLLSCNGIEPTKGQPDLAVSIAAKGEQFLQVSSANTANDSILFTQALIGVTQIELDAKHHKDSTDSIGMGGDSDEGHSVNDNSGRDDVDGEPASVPGNGQGSDYGYAHHGHSRKVEVEGEFIVDLITGTSAPRIEFDSIAPGMHHELEIEFAPILPNNKTIFIAFEVTRETAILNVEFSSYRKFEIEIKNTKGFQAEDAPSAQLLVLLDLNTLMECLDKDLDEATVDTDGKIKINEASNRKLFDRVARRFSKCLAVGEDNDYDGEIDK